MSEISILPCDNPATGKLTPFPISVSAHLPCRGCNCDRRNGALVVPFSFLQDPHWDFVAGARKRAREPPSWQVRVSTLASLRPSPHPSPLATQVRTLEKIDQAIAIAAAAKTKKARGNILRNAGLSLAEFPHYAMHKNFFPGFNVAKRTPFDPMHLFGDGATSYLGYWVFYLLICVLQDFSIKDANRCAPSPVASSPPSPPASSPPSAHRRRPRRRPRHRPRPLARARGRWAPRGPLGGSGGPAHRARLEAPGLSGAWDGVRDGRRAPLASEGRGRRAGGRQSLRAGQPPHDTATHGVDASASAFIVSQYGRPEVCHGWESWMRYGTRGNSRRKYESSPDL